MSKILYLSGLAVLGIALLMGSVAADTGHAEVGGCVITATYINLNTTLLDTNVNLGKLTASTYTPSGGVLGVVAGDDYTISVTSSPADGKMATVGGAHSLTNALSANSQAVSSVAASVGTGSANTLCPEQLTPITYSQLVEAGDITTNNGNYTIALTYTAALDI